MVWRWAIEFAVAGLVVFTGGTLWYIHKEQQWEKDRRRKNIYDYLESERAKKLAMPGKSANNTTKKQVDVQTKSKESS